MRLEKAIPTFEPPSETFCVLPWIHLSTRPNGHMRVCCTANASSAGSTNDKQWGGEVGILKNDGGAPANLNHTDLLTGWNNEYMKSIRRGMLRGDVPPSCSKCFKEEAAGHRSKRNWETDYWSKRIDVPQLLQETAADGSVPPKLYYLDLRLGTKCNLRCIMCSPHDSSQWVSDWNQLHPQIENPSLRETMEWPNKGKVNGASYDWHQNNEPFWKQIYEQIPHMRQLYFAGGESTIIEAHYQLLEECIRRGEAHHIELRYNSNGVELPERLFQLWEKFQRVRFHISIDSVGGMNEYIRFPSRWGHIEQQMHRLDATDDRVEVTIACAVQVLNILYLPDLIRWKLAQGFRKINAWPMGAGLVNFHFVYHPAHLNVKVLPPQLKRLVNQKYEEFYRWLEKHHRNDSVFLNSDYGIKRLKGIASFMDSEDWSARLPELREYIRLMDKIRGTKFAEVFPELAELVD